MSVTEQDRERAREVLERIYQALRTTGGPTPRVIIAAALADERDRARAPFLALADDLRREASFGDGTQRAYELDDLADRIRSAAEAPQ